MLAANKALLDRAVAEGRRPFLAHVSVDADVAQLVSGADQELIAAKARCAHLAEAFCAHALMGDVRSPRELHEALAQLQDNVRQLRRLKHVGERLQAGKHAAAQDLPGGGDAATERGSVTPGVSTVGAASPRDLSTRQTEASAARRRRHPAAPAAPAWR